MSKLLNTYELGILLQCMNKLTLCRKTMIKQHHQHEHTEENGATACAFQQVCTPASYSCVTHKDVHKMSLLEKQKPHYPSTVLSAEVSI